MPIVYKKYCKGSDPYFNIQEGGINVDAACLLCKLRLHTHQKRKNQFKLVLKLMNFVSYHFMFHICKCFQQVPFIMEHPEVYFSIFSIVYLSYLA